MPSRLLAALLAVVLGAAPVAAADLAAEPVEGKKCNAFNNWFLWGDPTACDGVGTVPACDAPSVVSAAATFIRRAEEAYRVPDLVRFAPVREAHHTFYSPSPLVRRYCVGSAELDNGDHTTAYYFIEEDAGFVGLSWKVYVCLENYDDWRVYDGRCRVARPAARF